MGEMSFVCRFREGSAGERDLLGGKGANLCEMTRLGLPVPPGFIITSAACREYWQQGEPPGLWEEVKALVHELEQATGRKFGDPEAPLLLSVRSGAKFSMPGMMDTILNLGLNSDTTQGLARRTEERFALDCRRRFIQLFARVVLKVPAQPFEDVLSRMRQRARVETDAELGPRDLRQVVQQFEAIVGEYSPEPFPSDPWRQLRLAIEAVFKSWNNPRAIAYREHHKIPHDLCTAVTVQAMVFGNMGWDSGSGVLFTRDPATGERVLYGEYLPNAQGEDVVSGERTPKSIVEMDQDFPEISRQLAGVAQRLEQHYRDVQDIEFTIEQRRLYVLQTRTAKRTALAAVRTAVEMVDEGLIHRKEALLRVPAGELAQLLLPHLNDAAKLRAVREGRLLARGLNASPGAATGKAVFDTAAAVAMASKGEPVVLVRPETSADDIQGIVWAVGVLTARGGVTSHAAVVTRGLGKPAIVGCAALHFNHDSHQISVDGHILREGDEISLDGFSGEVFMGRIETIVPDISSETHLSRLLLWADGERRLGVRANADTPDDARHAEKFGGEGIGLCRTEHMFFAPERLPFIRRVLMNARIASELEQQVEDARRALENAGDGPARPGLEERLAVARHKLDESREWHSYRHALDRLQQYQRSDFEEILQVMQGRPVVIRLLDAPLHEFLPSYESLLKEVTLLEAQNAHSPELAEKKRLLKAARSLREQNPMLGHRGCRVGLTYPEVYDMQVRAIAEAGCQLRQRSIDARPEVMIPLVADVSELKALKPRLQGIVEEVKRQTGQNIEVHFGTMIELPRAALAAGELAPEVAFFSFGSNDLTQMTFGFSRDDAEEKFLGFYLQHGLLPANPFKTLDEKGVGRLVRMAVEEGRQANRDLEIGLCGEHGGDPASIVFCHRAGLDYVSCSPSYIPIARLAAAQAALGESVRDV
ncbi:MAG: pyruvate, phosphate dikinase [Chloroflexi bacterium]|nr:pyruvate, phosphate dikinase [Chloroflexota bacterium]